MAQIVHSKPSGQDWNPQGNPVMSVTGQGRGALVTSIFGSSTSVGGIRRFSATIAVPQRITGTFS